MSEEANTKASIVSPTGESLPARPVDVAASEVKGAAGANGVVHNGGDKPVVAGEVATDAPVETTNHDDQKNDKQTSSDGVTQGKSAAPEQDTEMKEDIKPADDAPAADESPELNAETSSSAGKSKARRKSGAVPEHKGKKLNKKASKAKMNHIDAKPGDYFYVRLKGYPLWPAIVCDETMLPNTLLKSRPVTAAMEDGTYRPGYEDGGPKAKDRTFPVMYLHTNEFGWIPNYDLVDLNFDDVGNIQGNMRKDLAAAHQLAAEQHDLQYFKDILTSFMEAREAERALKEAAKAEKKAKKAAAKKEKKAAKAVVEDNEDEDIEMQDAAGEPDSEGADAEASQEKKSNKRKAEEDTPQRDSIKKPRPNIKLTTTPKATNGTSTPKSAKDPSTAKSAKPKTKKAAPKSSETSEIVVPKDPEMSAEEKRVKKEKEILFLRHKLQKGLLTRDQDPKEEEMKQMSEFVTKLEGYSDLEVSIIRATKINKVLKAMLKLPVIPKEEEFQFKPRSQSLLDKWNKLLASEQGTPVATSATTNGASEAKAETDDTKVSPVEAANGIKDSIAEDKSDEKAPAAEASTPKPKGETPGLGESGPAPSEDEPTKESIVEPTPVDSTA